MYRNVKIFSGEASKKLSNDICISYDGKPVDKSEKIKFSDGEFIVTIQDTVRGCDAFVIQSLNQPTENIFELLLMGDALKRASADEIIAVIPYMGFARQDRKCAPREPIGAKLLANLIQAAGFTRIVTLDLHSDQQQAFFDIPVDHLSSNYIFIPFLKKSNIQNLVICAPDVGASKKAKFIADKLHVDLVICHKYRSGANQISEMKLIGDVTGKNVVIVDDIVDTAGTLCKSAEMLMNMGASSVRAMITHPVLSGDAYKNIGESKLTELIVTDTIPLKTEDDSLTVTERIGLKKIKTQTIAELFANTMVRINKHESISTLF